LTYELAISEAGGPYEVFATPLSTELAGGHYAHTFTQSYASGMVRLRVLNGASVVDQAYLNLPLTIVVVASATPDVAPPGPSMALQNAPNPFAGETELSFTLPKPGATSVLIYDMAGRCVATVHKGELEGGMHRLLWDGRTDSGQPVASGVYRAIIKSADGVESRKVVKMR
jgi:hypothetical protein